MFRTLPSPLRRTAVVLLAAVAALTTALTLAPAAAAHIGVSSDDAAPGGYGKLTFRVPNESDTASTVALRVQVLEESALASLRAQPVPGWTAILTRTDLEQPLESHGQQISSYVSVVEWRADAGGGIAPGQFQEFALSGGPFPDADRLTLPAVQTYSDGTETAWIEPTAEGRAEPEHPAPVLPLAGDTAASTAAAAADAAAPAGHGHEVTGETIGGLALFVGILALFTGLAGVVLGYRAGRRTVSS